MTGSPEAGFVNVPTRARFIQLTTYRRSGAGVPTPLWFARNDRGGLYMVTHATAGKLKRLRANPRVAVAPCRGQGTPTGPEQEGTARVLSDDERPRAARAISRRYFFIPRALIELEMRRRGRGQAPVYLEATPGA